MGTEKEIDITVKLEHAEAMNEVYRDTIKHMGETNRHFKHIIIALIIGYIVGFGAFCWYESQFEYVSDSYEETYSTEGDNAYINNVEGSQYNDSASHTESGE